MFRAAELLTRRFLLRAASAVAIAAVALTAGRTDRSSAADVTPPNGFRPTAVAVEGATIVVSPGEVIKKGNIVVRDGRIVAVGSDVKIPIDAEVLPGKGLYVYPGFIDAGSDALINVAKVPSFEAGRKPDFESGVLAATPVDNRRGMMPEFQVADAVEVDEAKLGLRHKLGVTDVQVMSLNPVAGGQGCLWTLSALPQRESLLDPATCCTFKLTPPPNAGRPSTVSYPVTNMGAVAHLRQACLDAEYYRYQWTWFDSGRAGAPRPAHDPALEALGKVLAGDLRPVFIADTADEIDRALTFAEKHNLKPVLLGGREAAKRIDRIKAVTTGVILKVDFPAEPKVEANKPSEKLKAEAKPPLAHQKHELEEWKTRVATGAKLHKAGIPFAYCTAGLEKPEEWLGQIRKVIKEGLPADVALAAITRDAAKLSGAGQRLGTLEKGRLGHLVVTTAPWDSEHSKVRYVVIDGRTFEVSKAPASKSSDAEADAPQLAGKWLLKIESGEMETTDAMLEVRQEEGKLTGSFTSTHGNGKVASGSVKSSGAEFVVSIGAGDRALDLTFKAPFDKKPDGDVEKLKGTLHSPFGPSANWTAKREPKSEENNPVKLSLESDDKPKTDEEPNALPVELPTDRRKRPLVTGGDLLLMEGTVITVTGPVLEKADVLITKGKIAAVGPNLKAPKGTETIDVSGWYVMPGMIDTHSHIMISGGVNESSQSVVPEVRIKDVVRSDDPAEYRALAGGLTTARLLHGSANTIGGQDAVVKLKVGAPAAEHILFDAPQGVKFALGENVKSREGRFPNTRMGVEATLKRAFYEALDYRRAWQEYEQARNQGGKAAKNPVPPRRDLRLEALAGIINKEIFIHSHCYRADEILMLLRTAEQLGVRVQSLQHVLEGYKIAPEIAKHGASCSTFSDWWAYKIEAYDATPFNTTLLDKAGVNICVKSDNSELMRHMNLEAAKSLRYGNISMDHAFRMVTLHPARELQLDDRIGSIEVGKDGDVVVFNAHPFNPYARCELSIIEGEVLFRRKDQPTAMTARMQEQSAHPPKLELAAADVRQRKLDLPPSKIGTYAIRGATVHPVDGDDVKDGVVIVEEGKITRVGADADIPEGASVIDATGLHVYPGLIDAGTTLGIAEIGQVDVTQDDSDLGVIQPDLRAGIAVNVESELIPVARAGGITTAFIRPGGSVISGQYSLLQTAGWTSEEMVLDYTAGLSLDWPREQKRVEELKEFFQQARLYDKIRSAPPSKDVPPIIEDPRFEAMRPYVNGRKRVFVEANSRKAIAEALLFAEKEKLKLVITGGTDAWKLADELKQREVPVIVGPTMRSPVESWDPFDATYCNPGRLHEAGVLFAIRSDNASNSRNAAFEAAIAVAYGLPEAEALKAITLNAAKVLQIEDQVGSITPGKTANLVITDGSPLQQTTQIKGVFVAGKPYPPETKQTRLYEKYLQRLTAK